MTTGKMPKKATGNIKIVANTMCRVMEGESQNAWGVEFTAVASKANQAEKVGNGCVLVTELEAGLANEMIDCNRAIKF